jgi:two-component system cell cycle sensor histidine kinase/response regulator CckA
MRPTTTITLVVDDESVVRQLVRRILEPAVCRVMEAADEETALRLIERGRPAVDLVLTDLRMPGIDGLELMEVLAAHRPGLPVVCMSGFATVSAGPRPEVPFVAKPFTAESLRKTVEPLLARPRPGDPPAEPGAVDLVAAALLLQRQRAQRPPA